MPSQSLSPSSIALSTRLCPVIPALHIHHHRNRCRLPIPLHLPYPSIPCVSNILEPSHRLVQISCPTTCPRVLSSPQLASHRRKTAPSNPSRYQRGIRNRNDDGILVLVWISCPCSQTTGYLL